MKVDSDKNNSNEFEKLYATALMLYLNTDNMNKDLPTSEYLLDTLKENIHQFSLIRLLILKGYVKEYLDRNIGTTVNSYIYDNIKGIYDTMDNEVQRQEKKIRDIL